MTWHLPDPHGDIYRHEDGRELPRLSVCLDVHADFRIPDYIPPDVLERAANVGTVTHATVGLFCGHKAAHLPQLDDRDLKRAATAVAGWMSWYADNGEPKHEAVEVTLEGDGYVCTADWIGIVDGERWIIDWKTSNDLSADRGCVQLAGQLAAWERTHPDKPIDVCALVRLDKREPGVWESLVWDVEQMRTPREVLAALVTIAGARLPRGRNGL